MSCSNDLLAIRAREQYCLLDPSSTSQCAGPSTGTRHPRTCSSTSLPPHSNSSQADLHSLPDSLDEITLDSDLDQRSASSATLLSHRSDLPARLSESRRSGFLYPLHEPGQMTAQRIQRLRARTAAVLTSLPFTSEEDVDVDEHGPRKATTTPPVAQAPKLRRVSGIRNLRRAFCDHGPVHFASTSSLGLSKASYEFGILATQTPPLSSLSPHSSLRTLVDLGNGLPQSFGDLKTLCSSTFSSISVASRSTATKIHSTLPLSRPSHTCLSTDTSQSISRRKYLVHNPLTPRPHRDRHTSLRLDTPQSRTPGEGIWSCAKISQSALKRAARRGHPPRRVFSTPIAALSP